MRIYPVGQIEPTCLPGFFMTTDPVAAMMLTADLGAACKLSGLPLRTVVEGLEEHSKLLPVGAR